MPQWLVWQAIFQEKERRRIRADGNQVGALNQIVLIDNNWYDASRRR
jgi:hypothetical protein